MQTAPTRRNIFRSLCRLALDGEDLVIGSRMAGAESKMPLTRRIGNLFFAGLLQPSGLAARDRQRQRDARSSSGMCWNASIRCPMG